jgi:hypothetical protein
MLPFRGAPSSDDKLREPPMALNPGSSTRDSSPTAQHKVAFAALRHRDYRRIGLFNMSNNGLKAFSGVTVGVVGGLIEIHWSLVLSAMVLLAVTVALFALVIPGRGAEKTR